MKENKTVNREELEGINSELFHSFDPEEASWIIGGGKVCGSVSNSVTGTDKNVAVPQTDGDIDYQF